MFSDLPTLQYSVLLLLTLKNKTPPPTTKPTLLIVRKIHLQFPVKSAEVELTPKSAHPWSLLKHVFFSSAPTSQAFKRLDVIGGNKLNLMKQVWQTKMNFTEKGVLIFWS